MDSYDPVLCPPSAMITAPAFPARPGQGSQQTPFLSTPSLPKSLAGDDPARKQPEPLEWVLRTRARAQPLTQCLNLAGKHGRWALWGPEVAPV